MHRLFFPLYYSALCLCPQWTGFCSHTPLQSAKNGLQQHQLCGNSPQHQGQTSGLCTNEAPAPGKGPCVRQRSTPIRFLPSTPPGWHPGQVRGNTVGTAHNILGSVSKPASYFSFNKSFHPPWPLPNVLSVRWRGAGDPRGFPLGSAECPRSLAALCWVENQASRALPGKVPELAFPPEPVPANAAGIGCWGLMGSFEACAGECTLHPSLQVYKVLHTPLCLTAAAALTPAN